MLKTDELSELKGQFLTSLNHEIRTPLSGILGMTDLLLETALSEEQKDYVGATRLCAENLLEILNVTLEFSALSANHMHLEEAEFSLRETLAGLISEFSFKAESKDVRLRHNFDRNLPSAVVGDALRLRQLIWHLLGNAVKFTQRGEVEVSASASRRGNAEVDITIAVRDTGIGIRPEQVGSHIPNRSASWKQDWLGAIRFGTGPSDFAHETRCRFSAAPLKWKANWDEEAYLRSSYRSGCQPILQGVSNRMRYGGECWWWTTM